MAADITGTLKNIDMTGGEFGMSFTIQENLFLPLGVPFSTIDISEIGGGSGGGSGTRPASGFLYPRGDN